MTLPPPRSLSERQHDVRTRFAADVDAWVSTADGDGNPYLVPLSFLWDGAAFVISTVRTSPTSRNLLAGGKVRLALGGTRDVVLVEGSAVPIEVGEEAGMPGRDLGDAFAVKTGFDPRELATPYQYFRIEPLQIQAWREVNELPGRDVMQKSHWL
ncbi:pyridoxamine 5'-phosphate oxidase family protein [Streptomyces sp. AM8-1-1]|uniref:pyridoxamine 5'-phosphate oxidase family protein n=1 Tax=Streptomyces sp. AM8-1-1 TaxID=3075825 RepID=UPI0028C3D6DD|nr:pyridoxamine 5'-phosphate oxidase family protein [Streptomyces sp. AM8-1-1]WNO76537.1 pyridoxamine 5'-phosphate oxidase family protein [Streptomyces sp. AM8-1-1]